MLNFLSYLGLPLSKKKAEPPKRPKSCLQHIAERLEKPRGFSLVYIRVDKGDVQYISDLVNGRKIGPSQIGVIVREGKQKAVYSRLDKLANAEFDSSLRIAVETREKDSNVSAIEMLKRVCYKEPDENGKLAYEVRNYRAKKSIVAQEQPSPLCQLPVLAQ